MNSSDQKTLSSISSCQIPPVPSPRKIDSKLSNKEISDEAEKTRNCAVADKIADNLTKLYTELNKKWEELKHFEFGIEAELKCRNEEIEDTIDAMKRFTTEEILDVFKIEKLKTKNLEKRNETLTREVNELSKKLDIAEHKIWKCQIEIFDKIPNEMQQIVDEFSEKEIEMNKKNKELNEFSNNLREENQKFKEMLKEMDKIKEKNENLSKHEKELELVNNSIMKKNEKQKKEIEKYSEELGNLKQKLIETQTEVGEQSKEITRLYGVIQKEDIKNREKANKHEAEIQRQMDEYRNEVQRKMNQTICEKDDEIMSLKKAIIHREKSFEATIKTIKEERDEYKDEVNKWRQKHEMIESQMLGKLRRTITTNYKEMLEKIADGPRSIPSPPDSLSDFENPFLYKKKEMFNDENKKRQLTGRSSCPTSPKRNVGIQAEREKGKEASKVVRRVLPITAKNRILKK